MRATRTSTWVVLLSVAALGVACSGKKTSKPPPPTGVNADNHKWFPIDGGSTHDATANGTLTCDSCHDQQDSDFSQFDCISCHTHVEPVTDRLHLDPVLNTPEGTPPGESYAFASTNCYACHAQSKKIAFDHFAITDSCAMCHDVGTPFAALPVANFTHIPITQDCGGCHVTTSWLTATGAPTGLVNDPSTAIDVTAQLPSYGGFSLLGLTPNDELLPMSMNHDSTQIDPTALSDCANCHAGGSTGAGTGKLHSSLANLTVMPPSSCDSCHLDAQPIGFVGPLATSPLRDPTGPEMKHDAVSWNGATPTSMKLVPNDCGICHAPPSASVTQWTAGKLGTSPALFHLSLANAGLMQPGSCIDCHANTRPKLTLDDTNSSLSALITFDHTLPEAQVDCQACHLASSSAPFSSWSNAKYHLAGAATPAACSTCHAKERPTTTGGWLSTTYTQSPFDYVTNASAIPHGAGLDCATCHANPGTGMWGGTQNWAGGHFTHGSMSLSAMTCYACHSTQRPDLVFNGDAGIGFDHANNGRGDCFGCHQATVTAGNYVNYFNPATGKFPGDWNGGVPYPGSTLAGSTTQFITLNEIALVRATTNNPNNLVTSTSSSTVQLFNGMLHTSTVLPAALSAGPTGMPDYSKCWHCHTSTGTTVTSYSDGKYHSSLDNFTTTPGGSVVPFPQPTSQCADCHAQAVPQNIVEQAGSLLVAMDHGAKLKGSATINTVLQLDCSTCHTNTAGTMWSGSFHAKIAAAGAQPQECVGCHYLLMADAPSSDVPGGPGQDPNTTLFSMKHRSIQLTTQSCDGCHAMALGNATMTPAATLWKLGAFHPSVATQPAACVDCHGVSEPPANQSTQSTFSYVLAQGGTTSNGGQWLNHGSSYVAGKDCAVCHAADATPNATLWSKSDEFHASVATGVTVCVACHGFSNGNGSTPGTKNNLTAITTDTSTLTSADNASMVSPTTPAQFSHVDSNAAGRDCSVCHTQAGISMMPGVASHEWAQAKFHATFTLSNPLVMNGTTGRCSNCHLNEKPGSGFSIQDHTTFTNVPGTDDCAKCHSFPGTGSVAAPNWLGATGVPTTISVGGFNVTSPPAPMGTVEGGIMSLPHPTLQAGETCLSCHSSSSGGTTASGYDHASLLINGHCAACHEMGSNLVGTPWNGMTMQTQGAGDTRPYTLTSLIASYGSGMTVNDPNHFYAADCSECHLPPQGLAQNSTGAAYTAAWSFPHTTSAMTNPSTCLMCHTTGIPGAPDGGIADPAKNVTLTAQIPSYSATTLTSVTPQSETLAMTMVHSSADIPAAINSACENCHLTASQGNYFPGLFHSSLANLSQATDGGVPFGPAKCASCHSTAAPTGFVGPIATSPARTPASPEMKHDAVAWLNGAPTTTKLVSTECATCHDASQSLLTWADGLAGATPAVYHSALQAAGKAQPTSCIDCHANTRPDAVLTSANATLPANLSFDHTAPIALADCQTCHARSAQAPFSSWTGGQFHLSGSANPTTCLPCHAGERPTTTTGWMSATYTSSPFDYVTNASGATHGDAQDCASCHVGPGSGAWGGTQNWVGGHFTHGTTTVSGTTCGACHTTQRPTAIVTYMSVTMDHSTNGTGDCIGCHGATVTANTYVHYLNPSTNMLGGGDWQGGIVYPGSTYASALDQSVSPNEIVLNKTGSLVTSMSTINPPLYNGMLHTSAALPASLNAGPTNMPDGTKCWHCHTSTGTTVTSFKNGNYHNSLKTYATTPGGTQTDLGQPTSHCADCHLAMIPTAIVELGGSELQPMDHSAQFTATATVGNGSNTYAVTAVNQADCSACHANTGVAWSDGLFHANVVSGTPKDCVQCHYPLMADGAKADIDGGVGQDPNTKTFTMKHKSAQLLSQACSNCHTGALANAKTASHASTLWATGTLHPGVMTQPAGCLDCHTASEPKANASTQSATTYALSEGANGTSNTKQWMNHGSSWVAGKDCATCHAADAKPTGTLTFLNTDQFHPVVSGVTTCAECHGLSNGSTQMGAGNNMPNVVTDASRLTSSQFSPTLHDQIIHSDANVTSHDCSFCHTPTGNSWATATFHSHFTGGVSLILDLNTGRCSNCHLNIKPAPSQSTQNHMAFTNAPGTDDCSKCHSFPGTGTASAPNWLGATGVPTYLSFGFNVAVPPATGTVPIVGINNLPHPTVGAQACTTCHGAANPAGGLFAIGYDHAATALIASNCGSCHEAGSNMVGSPYDGGVAATMVSATCGEGNGQVRDHQGDTRPVGLTSLSCTDNAKSKTCGSGNCVVNHFYPTDCHECHKSPGTSTVLTTTGTGYVKFWQFLHTKSLMQQATCCQCHNGTLGNCSG